jgi:broad specificity phosphatase PhoE
MPLADLAALGASDFVLVRHGQTDYNVARCVNGDPSKPVHLTELGRAQARALEPSVARVAWGSAWHTRFPRTLETLDLLTPDGLPARHVIPELDDIDVGDLEGCTLDEYRAWKRERPRSEAFPGGESLDDAARRYARAFRSLLARPERCVLVVCHEIPLRYALNAAAGSDDLDGPAHLILNATPYLFDERSLERAAARIESLVGGTQGFGGE